MNRPQAAVGPRRLVVGAHYGVKDFLIQRITAVILVIYTVVLGIAALFTPEFNYEGWRNLFGFTCFGLPVGQMLATLAVVALAYHAWIGVRDIWMDYVKPTGVRLALQTFTLLWLVASVAFAAKILWSI